MAGPDRMTTEEVVRKVLLDEHADVLRESLKPVARELMEVEVSELIGAELGERPIVGVVDGGQLVALIGERDARGGEVLGHLLVAVEHPRPGRSARSGGARTWRWSP